MLGLSHAGRASRIVRSTNLFYNMRVENCSSFLEMVVGVPTADPLDEIYVSTPPETAISSATEATKMAIP